MEKLEIGDVTAHIIRDGKRNLRFSFESVPAMTLSPGSSEFHPIAGEIVDLFLVERFLALGFTTRRDYRTMIVDAWRAHAYSCGEPAPDRRISAKGKDIYYKCDCDKIYKITADGIKRYTSSKNARFWYDVCEAPQVEPDLSVQPTELLPLLRSVFRVAEEQELVFAALLLAFFHPGMVSPILVLLGSRGTSKTTTSKQLCELVSPSVVNPLVAFPAKEDALLAQLTNSYITAFDNVAFPITPRFADILCQLVTGSTYAKRKLYQDNEKLLIPLRGKAILNGIDEIASKDDFAERCCVITLAPIPPEERKTEREVEHNFAKVKPRLLGSIFNTLSAILANRKKYEAYAKPRMADYFVFGLKAMEAIGENPDDFAKAYLGNVDAQVADAEARLPIVRVVSELFHARCEASIKETPSELARHLNNIAQCNDIKLAELTPESVTKTLKKNAPALQRCGFQLIIPEGRKNKRSIELRASEEIAKTIRRVKNNNILDDLDDLEDL